jgi:hypothetical protein
MAGGAFEHVIANLTTSTTGATSSATYMTTSPQLKYLNLYGVGITLRNILGTGTLAQSFGTKPSWHSSFYAYEYFFNCDVCTWETCGGQSLSEISAIQSVSGHPQAWSSDSLSFVHSGARWFERGGYSGGTSSAGVFAAYDSTGGGGTHISFRASLVSF